MTTNPTAAPAKKRTLNPKIPWSTYADGRAWTLRRGTEYHGQTHQAISAARAWAWKNDYQLKVVGLADGNGFTVAFTLKNPPTGPHDVHPWQWHDRENIDGQTWDHYRCPGCKATMSQPIRPGSLL